MALLAAVMALWLPRSAHATTVVVLYIHDGIVIATDSRTSNFGQPPFGTACKLLIAGNLVASVSGVMEAQGGFDATPALKADLASAHTPAEAADQVIWRLQPMLAEVSARIEREAPLEFQQHLAGRFFQFFVAGIDSHGAAVIAARAIPYSRGRLQSENLTIPAGHIGRLLEGETAAITRYIDQTPNWVEQGDMVTKAVRFVEIEARDSPNWVGEPVSVLYIQKDGVHWVNRGVCP